MLSIIICSVDNSRFQRVCQEYDRVLRGMPYEIIRIDDATGMSEGYNRGVRLAKYDQLLFSHDDIEILEDDFQPKLMTRLGKYDLIGIAGATRVCGPRWIDAGPPYIFGQVLHIMNDSMVVDMYNNSHRVFSGMMVIDGVFMATHRRIVEKHPFDQTIFRSFHFYDVDFSLRLYMAGLNVAVCCDLGIIHNSGGSYNESWAAEAERFFTKHRSQISPQVSVKFQWGSALVNTRQSAKMLMNPDVWAPFCA
jgi:GT2 family glycosyltransferase